MEYLVNPLIAEGQSTCEGTLVCVCYGDGAINICNCQGINICVVQVCIAQCVSRSGCCAEGGRVTNVGLGMSFQALD